METTLFNKRGKPVAYIADDGEGSIYMWDGRAVAYLDGEVIHGWNGRHLGWFVEGILYDLHGKRVGFVREACPFVTRVEPVKCVKHVKYVKHVQHAAHVRAILSSGDSEVDLGELLIAGAV